MLALKSHRSLRRAAAAALATATAAAGLALTAAPAQARDFTAAVTVQNGVLSLVASDFNTDDVTVSYFFEFIQIQDNFIKLEMGALDAGVNCTQPYNHIIRCSPSGINSVRAILVDGDDSFTNNTSLPSDVSGGEGNDKLNGGPGKDRFFGGNGVDVLHGKAGNDDLEGGPGADDVYGDDGDDWLHSVYFDDELNGGNGNDTLNSSVKVSGGQGHDHIIMTGNIGHYYGNEGTDTVDYSYGWGNVTVSLDGNSNDDGYPPASGPGSGVHNVHSDVDIIIGGIGHDRLTGHDGSNRIEGGDGNDILSGKGGNDLLYAGYGFSQEIDGGSGHDECTGFNIVVQRGCD